MKRATAVSIRMVAERAGVSTATVSNVLTGKSSVSQDYAARVRAAAEDLGYVADSHASRLRSGRHSLAGVLVPDLANPMFAAFVSILERVARADGFDLLVVSADNDLEQEAERLRSIRSWRPAGLIVIPCDGALSRRLPKGEVPPIVVADRIPDDGAFDLIAVNNGASAEAITRHLAEQGRRSCLVVGSMLSISNVRERWEGAAAGSGPMAVGFLEAGFDPDTIRSRLMAHLQHRPRPDALFTLDHVSTLAAYQLLAELGVSIPGDIAFAGFDENEWMRLVSPAITAVRQPVQAMAEAAWARLQVRLAGDVHDIHSVRLACAIEIRGSTLRPSGQTRTAAA